MDDILSTALDWHAAGRGAALVTVMETWGSAPRRAGSLMVVDRAGRFDGSVSGGCVEGAVVAEAQAALADGRMRTLDYGVSDANAFAAGLACGGHIRLIVEPLGTAADPALLAAVVARQAARKGVARLIDLASGAQRLVLPGEGFDARMRADQSGPADGAFLSVHPVAPRLVVIGAVAIAQTLLPLARAVGHLPELIDPRPAFATAERFRGEDIIDAWPDQVPGGLALDERTAVVTLTHEPRIDDLALIAALPSPAYYVGALGSRRTHATRVERLRAAGLAAADIDRLDAPVGLPIGAATPAEIALSVMAAVVAALRGSAPGEKA